MNGSTDPFSDEALIDYCRSCNDDDFPPEETTGGLAAWRECRRRSDQRYADAEAAHNRQIQLLTKRIEELEQAARRPS